MFRIATAATVLLLAGGWQTSRAQWQLSTSTEPIATARMLDTCGDGAVNGLITVSIAATVALFAEVALPSYPILFTIGPVIGCPVRLIGKHLKEALLPR